MNILQIISSHNLTGAALPTLLLSTSLKEAGHNIFFVCNPSRGNLASRVEDENINLIKTLDIDPRKNPLKNMADIVRLAKLFDEYNINIVHSHLSHDHWISKLSSLYSRRKIIVVRTIHNIKATLSRIDHKFLYKNMCDRLISISGFHKRAAEDNFNINDSKIKVIYPSVNLDKFTNHISPHRIKKELSIPAKAKVVGFVSRFKSSRGHDVLIRVFARLKESIPEAVLLLVGKGELVSEIKSMTKELNFEDSVIFAGYRKDDLPEIYASMDVAVLLAEGNDGSCRAALEAMASGKPVVSFDFGAIREVLDDKVTGFVTEECNEENLFLKLRTIVKDDELRVAMGKKARIHAESRFNSLREAEEHEMVYRESL